MSDMNSGPAFQVPIGEPVVDSLRAEDMMEKALQVIGYLGTMRLSEAMAVLFVANQILTTQTMPAVGYQRTVGEARKDGKTQ